VAQDRPEDYAPIYAAFTAPISRFDCGKHCAPLNGGEPVCCSTKHAVPIVTVAEWRHLRARTDLWHIYRPRDAVGRQIKEELATDLRAVECRGAARCERENRSISCRTFPFFPYVTNDRRFLGLSYYWTFEDRCWVLSHLGVVDREFVDQCVRAFEACNEIGSEDLDLYREHSAAMRRVFSRWKRLIPVIARNGGMLAVDPKTGASRPAGAGEFPRHGPWAEEPASCAS